MQTIQLSIVVMLATLATTAAAAAPIKIDYSGTVTTAGPALAPTVVAGAPVTGTYVFDPSTPNTSATPAFTGDYAATLFEASVGGFFFTSTSAEIFVEPGSGEYQIGGLGGPGDLLNGHKLDVFGLGTSSKTEITTTGLPLTPPVLGTYELTLTFGLPPGVGDLVATIDQIAVEVPETQLAEPSTGPLLLAAFAALGLSANRRHKRSR